MACGGVKRLDERACEIKRMFVAPPARGQGVARALLGALEDEARRLGYAIARLDTGPHQPDAEHLYRSAGLCGDRELQREPVRELLGREAAGLSGRAPRPARPVAGGTSQPVVVSGRWRPTWPT